MSFLSRIGACLLIEEKEWMGGWVGGWGGGGGKGRRERQRNRDEDQRRWCVVSIGDERGRARNAMSLCTSIYRLSRGKRLYWAQGSTRRPVPSSSHRSRILPFFSGPRRIRKRRSPSRRRTEVTGRRNPAFKPESAHEEDDLS